MFPSCNRGSVGLMEAPCPRMVASMQSGCWLAHWIIMRARRRKWTPPPPSHCITDSVAGYHHIKLVLMNTSESTEERDNQTFIKCLNLLYMHNVMEREMGLWRLSARGWSLPQNVRLNVEAELSIDGLKTYRLIATLTAQLLGGIKWSKYRK